MALRSRSSGGRSWMPRRGLPAAGDRSRECHVMDRSPLCRRGWIVIRNSDEVRSLRLSGAVALAMAVAATVHTGLDLAGKSHLSVFWAKGEAQAGTLFERWNTYSRVRVREWAGKAPFGWGLARPSEARVDQHYIDIDADAG